MIYVGIVSSIDSSKRKIRAIFPDQDNKVSDWLQLVTPIKMDEWADFNMPEVGQTVLCAFLGNGIEKGFWLGVISS